MVFWLWIALAVLVAPIAAVGFMLAALHLYFRWKSFLRREWRKT